MQGLKEKFEMSDYLIKEIKVMRDLQKSYFKSRYDDPDNSNNILKQSKLQEKKVDQMLMSYFNKDQNTLF